MKQTKRRGGQLSFDYDRFLPSSPLLHSSSKMTSSITETPQSGAEVVSFIIAINCLPVKYYYVISSFQNKCRVLKERERRARETAAFRNLRHTLELADTQAL